MACAALLVRRLLWERVSADRIVGLVSRRTTDELQGMFLYGVEFVARPGNSNPADAQAPDLLRRSIRPVEKWNRVQIAPGVELHLSSGLPRFKPTELQRLLEILEQVLREFVY
jgi:predicted metal-dependent TIM-barrel fold hydrolase